MPHPSQWDAGPVTATSPVGTAAYSHSDLQRSPSSGHTLGSPSCPSHPHSHSESTGIHLRFSPPGKVPHAAMGKPRVPFRALQVRHPQYPQQCRWCAVGGHSMGWTGSPSHSSAVQATSNPSQRRPIHRDPGPAHTRESRSHTLLWGQTQGTAHDPNPTVCGTSKKSHSRIRSRTDFSIKLWAKLTCSCFTGLLTLLSPTASHQSKEVHCNQAQTGPLCGAQLFAGFQTSCFSLADLSHSRATDSSITQDAPPHAARSGRSGAGRGGHARTATRAQ